MHINVIRKHGDVIRSEWVCRNIKDVLCGLKFHHGRELTDSLLNDNYKYILMNQDDPDSAVCLSPEVIGSSLEGLDTLIIARDVSGEIPAAAVAAMMVAAGATVTATSVSVLVVTALLNIGLSVALNAVMSLLSPTPEFSSDPAFAQRKQSALFNGAPVIREQGGIVPWILGAPFCGGVLISSGISSEEV